MATAHITCTVIIYDKYELVVWRTCVCLCVRALRSESISFNLPNCYSWVLVLRIFGSPSHGISIKWIWPFRSTTHDWRPAFQPSLLFSYLSVGNISNDINIQYTYYLKCQTIHWCASQLNHHSVFFFYLFSLVRFHLCAFRFFFSIRPWMWCVAGHLNWTAFYLSCFRRSSVLTWNFVGSSRRRFDSVRIWYI